MLRIFSTFCTICELRLCTASLSVGNFLSVPVFDLNLLCRSFFCKLEFGLCLHHFCIMRIPRLMSFRQPPSASGVLAQKALKYVLQAALVCLALTQCSLPILSLTLPPHPPSYVSSLAVSVSLCLSLARSLSLSLSRSSVSLSLSLSLTFKFTSAQCDFWSENCTYRFPLSSSSFINPNPQSAPVRTVSTRRGPVFTLTPTRRFRLPVAAV